MTGGPIPCIKRDSLTQLSKPIFVEYGKRREFYRAQKHFHFDWCFGNFADPNRVDRS